MPSRPWSCRMLFSTALAIGLAVATLAGWPTARANTTLITEEEALLKDAPLPDGHLGGYARRPEVKLVEPKGKTEAPFKFVVRFRTFGSAKIVTKDVKAIYHKVGGIDITHRLKHGLSAEGIEILDAVAPPGEHIIRIEVEDSEGTVSTSYHPLKVLKKR